MSLFKKDPKSISRVEGFEQQTDEFLLKEGGGVYDDFYADIYDQLVFNQAKDNYEIGQIVNNTKPTRESIILDVGSGTGHHVNMLASQGYNVTGIDNSPAMVKKAKANYPKYNFMQGDVIRAQQFKPSSFTHILCLYFSIYYFKDKLQFFKNCMSWLKPGGYLVVHIVDREKFDPILPPGNPLLLVSPQRYAKERITKTSVVFNNMEYVANFDLHDNQNVAYFEEKFTQKDTGKVRKNKHTLYMETDKQILAKAQMVGFIYQGQIDLIKSGYEYQYLYIFVKPN
jgi:SAM-dependent methyltransferase